MDYTNYEFRIVTVKNTGASLVFLARLFIYLR